MTNILLIIGLIFSFFSAVSFAIPILKRRKEIEKETEACWDYNSALRQELLRDRKFAFVGLFLLSIGFLFDALALAIPSV